MITKYALSIACVNYVQVTNIKIPEGFHLGFVFRLQNESQISKMGGESPGGGTAAQGGTCPPPIFLKLQRVSKKKCFVTPPSPPISKLLRGPWCITPICTSQCSWPHAEQSLTSICTAKFIDAWQLFAMAICKRNTQVLSQVLQTFI